MTAKGFFSFAGEEAGGKKMNSMQVSRDTAPASDDCGLWRDLSGSG